MNFGTNKEILLAINLPELAILGSEQFLQLVQRDLCLLGCLNQAVVSTGSSAPLNIILKKWSNIPLDVVTRARLLASPRVSCSFSRCPGINICS